MAGKVFAAVASAVVLADGRATALLQKFVEVLEMYVLRKRVYFEAELHMKRTTLQDALMQLCSQMAEPPHSCRSWVKC